MLLSRRHVRGRLGERKRRSRKFYSLACEGKIYEACEALGRLYEDGEAGFAQDIKAARSYYDKACAVNAYKCSGSERLDELYGGWAQYQSGQFEAAYELGKESCARGVANGCAALAQLYAKGLGGVRQNSEQAVKFHEKACEGGFGASCAELGDMLFHGRSVKKDVPRALELFEKAGLLWRLDACESLADAYFEGVDVPQDIPKAFNFYGIACYNGLKPACTNLGAIYERGVGEAIKADENEADSLFSEACEAGNARGCLNLARRLESSDKKQAAALRQKAQKLHEKECEAGLAKKCMEFKKSTNKGEKHEF